jgi:hypothetical protein
MFGHHPDLHITAETHWFDDLRVKMPKGQLDAEQTKACEDWFLSLSHRPFGHQGDPELGWLKREDMKAKVEKLGGGADSHFEAYCLLDAEKQNKSRWGEKTPRHVFRISDIIETYPHAKIICMARDPRGVVASYRDWKSQGGHDFDKDPEHSKALQKEHLRTRASYHILIASLLWNSTIKATLAGIQKYGEERIKLLRYEDLVLEPEKTNNSICEWLGIKPDAYMLDVPMVNSSFQKYDTEGGINRDPVEGWRKRLSKGEVGTIQSACRKAMQTAGYQIEPVGAWQFYGLCKWLSLPFAVLRAARANRNRLGSLPTYILRRLRA